MIDESDMVAIARFGRNEMFVAFVCWEAADSFFKKCGLLVRYIGVCERTLDDSLDVKKQFHLLHSQILKTKNYLTFVAF